MKYILLGYGEMIMFPCCSCLLFVIGIVFVIGYYAKFTFVTAYCAYIFLSAGIVACCGSIYVVKLALSGDDGGDYFRWNDLE